jgi:hypothetical protein
MSREETAATLSRLTPDPGKGIDYDLFRVTGPAQDFDTMPVGC